jgi:hypothetical protein
MSFKTGSVSIRAFFLERQVQDTDVDGFKDHSIQSEANIREEDTGWATNRYLMDRNITEDSAYCGGYLNLNLTSAERKVPAGLLSTECRIEEIAQMQAMGKSFLSGKERKEIKQNVKERLLPNMPLNIKGIGVVANGDVLYAEATTDKKSDMVAASFIEATGMRVANVTPETMYRKNGGDVNSLQPSSFSDNALESVDLGEDFLTWLWYKSDTGTAFNVNGDTVEAFVEGPMTLVSEGEGAHEAILRKGVPSIAKETQAAFITGKKLRVAKVTFAKSEDEIWSCKLNANTFTFGGLKVPKAERKLDAASKFQQNIMNIEAFFAMFNSIYSDFCNIRKDDIAWKDEVKAIVDWMENRNVK